MDNVMEEVFENTTSSDPVSDEDIKAFDKDVENESKELSDKEYAKLLSNEINTDVLKDIIRKYNINELEMILKVQDLIKRRLAGENFNAYAEFPEQMKSYINLQVTMSGNLHNRAYRNAISESVLNNLIEEYRMAALSVDLDTLIAGTESEIKNITSEFSMEIGKEFMNNMNKTRISEMEVIIEKAKADGNDALASKMSDSRDSILEAYNLTDFKEFCKKEKFSTFDCQKPSRKMDIFYYKYNKSNNNIDDIKRCTPIIIKHIPEYKDKAIKIILAFCDYIVNKDADDFKDHTFMYYFVRNIIVLDKINPRNEFYDAMDEDTKEFYDGLIANLKECMDNIK